MLPEAVVVDSDGGPDFPFLRAVRPDKTVPDPRPRRIVLWDEVGEAIAALMRQPGLEPGSLTVFFRPENLAAPYLLKTPQPSPLQVP